MDNFDEETIVEKDNFKSKKIIVVLIVIILAGVFVFFYKNMTELPTNSVVNNKYEATGDWKEGQLFKIQDEIYSINEFEKYMYIYKIVNENENLEIDPNEIYEILDEFILRKIYATAATQKSITFSEEELKRAKDDYSTKSGDFVKHGIAETDYLRYAEDEYKMNTLYIDFVNYYELPDDIYKEVVESYSGDDLKSYSYRMMKFFYEESENIATDEIDKSKTAVELKAQAAWNAVKSGDDFETVAKEYADGEYAMNGNSFTFLNGQIQNKVAPIIKNESLPSFLGGGLLVPTELFESMKQIESGEYTDIIEIPGESMYCFAKLESASDGFVGDADKEFRKVILNEYQYNLLIDIYNFDFEKDINTSSLAKFLYK